MSERISWITHQAKKILFLDASGLKGEAYMQLIDEIEAVFKTLPKRSTLLLIDCTGSASTPKTTARQKAIAQYTISTYAAIVGVTGVKKVIAQAIKPDFHYASSVEDAKAWLVRQ
jgi:hypothetical protein